MNYDSVGASFILITSIIIISLVLTHVEAPFL